MEALLTQPEGTLSVHTPETLGRAVQSAVAHALGSASWQLVQVSGVYRAKKTAPYGAYYYDRLEAEDSSTQLTLLVPKALRGQLVSGSSYVFSGQVGIYTHKGDLDVRLTVAAVTGRDDSSRLERLRAEQALLERKMQRSPREVLKRHLERGERPRIALISGRGAIVGHDMFNQLGDAAQAFDFIEVKTNLSRPHEVARTLSEIDPKSVDVVALIRGGGDLDGVDALEVGEAAVRLSVPLITAIGHAEDKPLLQKLADVPLITPTELGSYLRALAWEARQPIPDTDTVTVSYELPGTDTRPRAQMRGVAATRRRREAQRQTSKRGPGRVVVGAVVLALVLYTVLALQGVLPDAVTPLLEGLSGLVSRVGHNAMQ